MSSSHDDALKTFGDETEAIALAAQPRLRRRLEETLPDAARVRALLRHLPSPPRSGERRVLDRARRTVAALSGAESTRGQLRPGLTLAALAAKLLAVLLLPRGGERTPAPLVAISLDSTGETTELEPTPGVLLSYDGDGVVSGTDQKPDVWWAAGTITIEVEPDRGIGLTVHTSHGEVRVIGTIFTVSVDDIGTHVAVARGKVEVACELGTTRQLTADQDHTCVHTTPASLLNMAVQLRDRGSGASRVLTLVDRALDLDPPDGPVRSELLLMRLQALLNLDLREEAREAADDYLRSGDPSRRTDVLRTTAKLSFSEDGCSAAVPYLQELRGSGGARVGDLLPLAQCLLGGRPDDAREVLDEASRLGPTTSEAERITRLRASLPVSTDR